MFIQGDDKKTLKASIDVSNLKVYYPLEFLVGATISVIKYWYEQGRDLPMEQLSQLMHQLMDNKFRQDLAIT